MSVAAMTWALSQWLDPGPKMVLVAIADRVNHKGDDDSGFTIAFRDASGAAVARTFDYVAAGYGQLRT